MLLPVSPLALSAAVVCTVASGAHQKCLSSRFVRKLIAVRACHRRAPALAPFAPHTVGASRHVLIAGPHARLLLACDHSTRRLAFWLRPRCHWSLQRPPPAPPAHSEWTACRWQQWSQSYEATCAAAPVGTGACSPQPVAGDGAVDAVIRRQGH